MDAIFTDKCWNVAGNLAVRNCPRWTIMHTYVQPFLPFGFGWNSLERSSSKYLRFKLCVAHAKYGTFWSEDHERAVAVGNYPITESDGF